MAICFYLSFLLSLQLFIEARDGGLPRKTGRPYRSSTHSMLVNINRNAGAPTFDPSSYTLSQKLEHFPTGEDLAIIELRDPDGDEVAMYVDYTRPNSDYFIMVEDKLQLIKPLTEDPQNLTFYTVYIWGRDIGNPSNNATNTAEVRFSVDRNDFPPEFINAPYSENIDRTANNGQVVTSVSWKDDDNTAPYGEVTVTTLSPSSGYASQIFRLDNVVGNSGDIVVYNSGVLQSDDASVYTVSEMI